MKSQLIKKVYDIFYFYPIASMSERRIERLVNPALSGLPPFLVSNGGLNSGFMMPHCTAAALGMLQSNLQLN